VSCPVKKMGEPKNDWPGSIIVQAITDYKVSQSENEHNDYIHG
jgi:hypothetical protein